MRRTKQLIAWVIVIPMTVFGVHVILSMLPSLTEHGRHQAILAECGLELPDGVEVVRASRHDWFEERFEVTLAAERSNEAPLAAAIQAAFSGWSWRRRGESTSIDQVRLDQDMPLDGRSPRGGRDASLMTADDDDRIRLTLRWGSH